MQDEVLLQGRGQYEGGVTLGGPDNEWRVGAIGPLGCPCL